MDWRFAKFLASAHICVGKRKRKKKISRLKYLALSFPSGRAEFLPRKTFLSDVWNANVEREIAGAERRRFPYAINILDWREDRVAWLSAKNSRGHRVTGRGHLVTGGLGGESPRSGRSRVESAERNEPQRCYTRTVLLPLLYNASRPHKY